MNIYAGSLSYDVTEEDLKQAFEAFGEVESVKIIKDMDSVADQKDLDSWRCLLKLKGNLQSMD